MAKQRTDRPQIKAEAPAPGASPEPAPLPTGKPATGPAPTAPRRDEMYLVAPGTDKSEWGLPTAIIARVVRVLPDLTFAVQRLDTNGDPVEGAQLVFLRDRDASQPGTGISYGWRELPVFADFASAALHTGSLVRVPQDMTPEFRAHMDQEMKAAKLRKRA